MSDGMTAEQIKLEKTMIETAVKNYRAELEKAKENKTFGCTNISVKLISEILDKFSSAVNFYVKAKPMTIASIVIKRFEDIDTVAFIASRIIFNSLWSEISLQSVYQAVGQAMEYEYKMRKYKEENYRYYKTIQDDLNKRCAKPIRKKTITSIVFKKRLNFHLEKWSVTEKFQAGQILVNLFVQTTHLAEFEDIFRKNKHIKILVPTEKLVLWTEKIRGKMEVMQPLFLPMVCKPKDWISIFEGGYISPYMRKNKLIKNDDREYLIKLEKTDMPMVYDAINHLQSSEWQINRKLLAVVKALWEQGGNIAKLPPRNDEELIPFPYPEKLKNDIYTDNEALVVGKWKRDTYEIHKRNVRNRSLRLSTVQILDIAEKFQKYDKIWFPYQMDFRGRLYPMPVLLQPQGNDLAKSLLHFAEGKETDEHSINWLKIHGANLYGYDKDSYEKRIEWVENKHSEIQSYAENPLENRGWAKADKPFQFLAFCFEYSEYLSNPKGFKTHIPVLLDGTCNGLQHYSALLRDSAGGRAVNLINSEKPNDIYSTVADNLKAKLELISSSDEYSNNDKAMAKSWLDLGINRKLTKRPVMVLPYGGTILSCREYISEYMTDNYKLDYLQAHFNLSENPSECVFKSSAWLGQKLWAAIQETICSATRAMTYIRKIAKTVTKKNKYLEWQTPAGLLVRQGYNLRKRKEIKTELYGRILKTNVNIDERYLDSKRQLNGICPNFIHSMDAACLMLYIVKCKKAGVKNIMTVHDCYGTYASDTDISAKNLREAFVEIYKMPVLENFANDISGDDENIIQTPEKGDLNIEDVLQSSYFFN